EPAAETPAEELTVSELEELLRKKKNNKTKALPVDKVAGPLSPEEKKGTSSLKPPPGNLPQSKVSSDGKTFDWGSVFQGEIVTHDFKISNPGPTPLIIEDVKPACGCTRGTWTETIAPGGTGKVSLSIRTVRLAAGKIRKTADVITKAQGKMILVMEGEVEVAVVQEPPPAKRELIKVSGVPLEQMKIALRKGTKKTFKINNVSCPNRIGGRGSPPLVTLELLEFEGGSDYQLVVTPQLPLDLDPDNPHGFYTANIVANVTVEGKTFDLPLNVPITIKKRIDVEPRSVLFFKKDSEKIDKPGVAPATKEILIKSLHPAHSFNITGIRVQGEHLKVRLETVAPGKEYKLAIELAKKPNATTSGKIIETILIDTDDDDPNLQEFKIQVTLRTTKKNKSPINSDLNGGKEPTKNNPAPNATGGSS
ncbi:MAG: DUF1573 domain-containing protein, partial [Planctomycetota bacterium]|nr:DUF1573 domain-containing protein [Planctomycetota bacterium]